MIQKTELQRARVAYAEALKSALAGSGLSRDEVMGRLSAEISDLWNQMELDLQRPSRRSVPARQVEPVAPDALVNEVGVVDVVDESPVQPPIDCVADAEHALIAALKFEPSGEVKRHKK